MNTIASIYEQALMAESAYADLADAVGVDNKVILKDLLIGNKFSETQATTFSNQWEVKDHIPNTASGFSATIFFGTEKEIAGRRAGCELPVPGGATSVESEPRTGIKVLLF